MGFGDDKAGHDKAIKATESPDNNSVEERSEEPFLALPRSSGRGKAREMEERVGKERSFAVVSLTPEQLDEEARRKLFGDKAVDEREDHEEEDGDGEDQDGDGEDQDGDGEDQDEEDEDEVGAGDKEDSEEEKHEDGYMDVFMDMPAGGPTEKSAATSLVADGVGWFKVAMVCWFSWMAVFGIMVTA